MPLDATRFGAVVFVFDIGPCTGTKVFLVIGLIRVPAAETGKRAVNGIFITFITVIRTTERVKQRKP